MNKRRNERIDEFYNKKKEVNRNNNLRKNVQRKR